MLLSLSVGERLMKQTTAIAMAPSRDTTANAMAAHTHVGVDDVDDESIIINGVVECIDVVGFCDDNVVVVDCFTVDIVVCELMDELVALVIVFDCMLVVIVVVVVVVVGSSRFNAHLRGNNYTNKFKH
jgi:hypothetical protein